MWQKPHLADMQTIDIICSFSMSLYFQYLQRRETQRRGKKRLLCWLLRELLMSALPRHYCADDDESPDLSVSAAAQMRGNTWGQRPWDGRGSAEIVYWSSRGIKCPWGWKRRERSIVMHNSGLSSNKVARCFMPAAHIMHFLHLPDDVQRMSSCVISFSQQKLCLSELSVMSSSCLLFQLTTLKNVHLL